MGVMSGFFTMLAIAIGVSTLHAKIKLWRRKPRPKHSCKGCLYQGSVFYDLITKDLFLPCLCPERVRHSNPKARVLWECTTINLDGECPEYRPTTKPKCESWPECRNCDDRDNPPCSQTLIEQQVNRVFEEGEY